MTVQEYNDNLSEFIALSEVSLLTAKAVEPLKEFDGKWDELLQNRESEKRNLDYLFSELTHSSFPLASKNRVRIVKLKKTFYPLLLCGLAKCYLEKGRLKDAESVLLEARSLGSQGAEVLLFYLYGQALKQIAKGNEEASIQRLIDAFNRVKNIDILSETVTKEMNNELYQCNSLCRLSADYRLFDNDVYKSYQILVRALGTDWHDNYKEHIRGLLSHYRETSRGNYTYVE